MSKPSAVRNCVGLVQLFAYSSPGNAGAQARTFCPSANVKPTSFHWRASNFRRVVVAATLTVVRRAAYQCGVASAIIFGALFGTDAAAARPHPRLAAGWQGPASTEFLYYQRNIFIRVRVDATPDALFLLDTGASASAVDLKAAERWGLPYVGEGRVEGSAGVVETKQVAIKVLAVGAARAVNLKVPAYDLGGFLTPAGRRLDGILGYDFMRRFSVRIDFAGRVISFTRGSPQLQRDRAAVASVPFKLDNGIPRLSGVLNREVAADFRIDTGASLFETEDVYLNVTEETWKHLTAKDKRLAPERHFKGVGAGGREIVLRVARIREFSLGGLIVPAPFVIVQPRAGYFARPDAAGFVGNNFLEKFSPVTISYPGRHLYLSKNIKHLLSARGRG